MPLRKPGKLPYRTYSLKYDLEYGQAELHMHIDGVDPGAGADGGRPAGHRRDDGGRLQLIEQAGGTVAGCAFLVELAFLAAGRSSPGTIFSAW